MNDILAFIEVAREQSFTRAAKRLGVSPSALSHTIRNLEARLGLRLLTRTTRNVAPTDAGEHLMKTVAPLFAQISSELDKIGELRDKPAGTIRITCSDDAAEQILRPVLPSFFEDFPEINIEIAIDYGFTNIVEQRFDAGIRLGESVSKDMIAVRLGPDWRLSVVGSPAYFKKHAVPDVPHDLTTHHCINIRHSVGGSVYAWEFEKDGRTMTVRVSGQMTANSNIHILNGALDGIGLAYIPDFMARPYIESGRLIEVLADWSPYFPGFHLYYPNRRNASPAFTAFVNAVRHKG
ncbi:LysR family transcriptional regulator [Yersinia pseudotuberculosis]|uniref:LysR family transcriptional regulator n=1 Tax=Yersinia pseudotuberculosis TaxID=633 RepID=UPI001A9E84ED|nr:LysR family transcriptional regulator [Yersinia pseudotuberculosis]MBO1552119.1 LysR family transcriptional regulator [Yersinia pseudotuberculosis]MBO1572293.1 LysR family transcriptional regulator [Yersinia pseudotuberculosis]MBO1587183.1 LysR family transcriptional regulator [Yersinia pseudotuberculosis]MBO1636719.1 LysR family transcriptional regulator [Yersinia pseudotuberculosis]